MLAKLLPGAGGFRGLPTFVSSSINRVSASTNTVTAPSGIQDGDLLVGLTYVGGTATVTPPSGFSQIYADQLANPGATLNVKIAQSESGNYTFTASTSINFTATILVYRNATAVNTVGGINRVNSATATALSVTPTNPGILLAAFSNSNGAATITTPPAGMTQRAVNAGASTPPNLAIYDVLNTSTGATGDKTLVWSTSATVSGFLLQVANEPNVEPEFVASASTTNSVSQTTIVVNKPTGTIEGDLMIAFMGCGTSGSGFSWTGDTGWTEVCDQVAGANLRIAYKVATASEPSSYTFTLNTSVSSKGASILTYRYAAYDTIAGAFTTGANPLVLSSISPSLSQSLLLAVGARAAASVTLGTPTSMTARVTDNDATAPSYIVCDQTVSKGPTGTRSISTGSTTNVAGIMLAIKPTRSLA